jgi:hypothetical protein
VSQGNDQVRETRGGHEEQDEFGNSLADLRANLKLSILDRLRKAENIEKELVKFDRGLKRKT